MEEGELKKSKKENKAMAKLDYIQKCWEARNQSALNNYGHYPDYILVHPGPFQDAVRDILPETMYKIFQFGTGIEKMWGMKVIETTAISEDLPVCLIEKIGR